MVVVFCSHRRYCDLIPESTVRWDLLDIVEFLAPRTNSGSGGTNNLPPLLFHQVHGDNIRIIRDGFVARRAESFCKGVTFTNRPVKVAERVYIKFLEVSSNWSGVIRLGFTCNDPITLRNGLPKYACPDLTNKPGYWAKALAERFCARDTILFFYVTSAGDVHFGIDGEEKGIFLSGVDTRNQLWAMIDVYGNSTEIELLDARQHLNNSRRIISNGITDSSPEVVDRRLITSMQALSVSHGGGSTSPPPGGREADQQHQPPPPPPHYTPLVFHRTRGRNVRLSNDRCIATRSETEFCQGYVFTARPLQLGERILIQVLATETVFLGALALGLTSCDPATLTASDLPDDSDLLLDRPEYWVVSKDVANYPQRGDELTFSITHSGEVQMSKNGSPPVVLMHVDQSLTLWAFLDVYGSTSKIRILGSSIIEPPRSGVTSPLPREEPQQQPPPQIVRASSAALVRPGLRVALPDTRHSELVQLGGAVPGGTVLVVNLPPPQSHPHPHPHQSPPPDSTAATSATLLSTYSHTYIEPVSASSYTTVVDSSSAAAAAANMSNMREWAETSVSAPSGSECSICYERAIDSVLYMCGHMCMCYECAVQQWRGKGGGHCPLCRAVIRDVIRTYKS